jgi:hypothetical protein
MALAHPDVGRSGIGEKNPGQFEIRLHSQSRDPIEEIATNHCGIYWNADINGRIFVSYLPSMNNFTPANSVDLSSCGARKPWNPPTIEESSIAAVTATKFTGVNNEGITSKAGS